jgi:hypothetical protein
MKDQHDLSPELIGWVDRQKKEILNRLQTGPLKIEQNKEQFMKRMIKTPQILSEAWLELIRVMEELKAPADVVYEAQEVSPVLSANLKGKAFSIDEQEELLALVHPLEAAKTDSEKLSILQGAIRQGKLSKQLADRIVRLVPNTESQPGTQESASSESVIAMRFNWGMCGFCGAMGFVEGGPVGGAAACLICGAFG